MTIDRTGARWLAIYGVAIFNAINSAYDDEEISAILPKQEPGGPIPQFPDEFMDVIVEEAMVLADCAERAALRVEQRSAGHVRVDRDGLAWRVVANAGHRGRRKPRWAHVADATGYGNSRAQELCREAGFNPDETCGDPFA